MQKTITIAGDITVNRIGLGTNRIQDNETSKNALKKAVALGINFIDTASAYTSGVSETVIGATLAPYEEGVIIATKGGMHPPDFRVDSRPEALRQQLETSLKRLHLPQIPLYFLHRVDPKVSLKESVLFLKEMQEQGKIKHIGLSEVTVDQIKEAQSSVSIVAVENQYNLVEREHEQVIDYCEEQNIAFVPWFPLGRGNMSAYDELLETLGQKYHATPTQIALSWLLHRSPVILPIPGSLSPAHLEENIKTLAIDLSEEDFHMISQKQR